MPNRPAPAPAAFHARTPDGTPAGTGPDPIAAVRAARAAGFPGALEIATAAGIAVMTAAPGWNGEAVWGR